MSANTINGRQYFCKTSGLLAGSGAAIELQAAPGAGKTLVITSLFVVIGTSAAQTVSFGDNAAQSVLVVPASAPLGAFYPIKFKQGMRLAANTAFQLIPSGAGVALTCSYEGFID